MVSEKNVEIMDTEKAVEIIEEQIYKPQKSLIEKMSDYEQEIDRLRIENRDLREEAAKSVMLQSQMDILQKERLPELIQRLNRKDDEILILQLQMDDLQKEKEELVDGNDWLRYRLTELKSELKKIKTAKEQTSNSEETLKQIDEELSKELETLKAKSRGADVNKIVNSLLFNIDLPSIEPLFNIPGETKENRRLCEELQEAVDRHNEDKRKLDWTMMQIETHIQQVSSLVYHLREEVLL